MIDAESEYEGRYAAATRYIERLRAAVGADFPLGLAAFPYVHYHPAFPYSVFLAPGAAEFNLPQVYWKAIGDSVDRAMTTTYTYNRVYGRPIAPIGQLYDEPRGRDVAPLPPAREGQRVRRRLLVVVAARLAEWLPGGDQTPRRPRARLPAELTYPELESGAEGDLVVWAQEHLAGGRVVRRRRSPATTGCSPRAGCASSRVGRPRADRRARRAQLAQAARERRAGHGAVGERRRGTGRRVRRRAALGAAPGGRERARPPLSAPGSSPASARPRTSSTFSR